MGEHNSVYQKKPLNYGKCRSSEVGPQIVTESQEVSLNLIKVPQTIWKCNTLLLGHPSSIMQ